VHYAKREGNWRRDVLFKTDPIIFGPFCRDILEVGVRAGWTFGSESPRTKLLEGGKSPVFVEKVSDLASMAVVFY